MATYLVEFFAPRSSPAHAALATGVAASGLSVRTISVPEDETVFWLVDAASADDLARLLRRAGLDPERVVEAHEREPTPEEQAT